MPGPSVSVLVGGAGQSRLSPSAHDAYGSSSSSRSKRLEDPPPDSSRWRRSRSVCGVLYFSSRATLVCFAFARPRPIDLTPSETVLGYLGGAHRKCEYLPAHRIACPARNVRPGVAGWVFRGLRGGPGGGLRLAAEPAHGLPSGLWSGLLREGVGIDRRGDPADLQLRIRGHSPPQQRESHGPVLVVLDHGAAPTDRPAPGTDLVTGGGQIVDGAVEVEPQQHPGGAAEVV